MVTPEDGKAYTCLSQYKIDMTRINLMLMATLIIVNHLPNLLKVFRCQSICFIV